MPQTISPLDILTSSGKYKEREQHEECTSPVRINAADLAERVSKLLDELGFRASVSSGFRTAAANSAANGAKRSAHQTGEAVDLVDPQGKLAQAILADTSILEKYDLYMENPQYTNGWVHLQSRRTKSGNRIFIP